MSIALFLSILLVAACGLIYELIAGTVASYLVGDSVFQFSTVIGTYLFAMGIGSFLSRFVRGNLARLFVRIEILIAVVGGFSSSALFLAFAFTQGFQLLLYLIVLVVGTLVGLEIPLLMRLVKDRYQFRDAVSHVLTFDYLGALFASVLFPLVLVPKLGLIRSALFFGIVNAAGRAVEHAALRRADCQAAASSGRVCRGDRGAVRGVCRRLADQRVRRGQHLRRRDHPLPRYALSAHRPDAVEGRSAAVPELASAVQLARRVSLSRSARASGTGVGAGAAPRAGAGGRRRTRRPRDSEVPARSSASCSSISTPR